jgi:DnaJ-class molecular chaperone
MCEPSELYTNKHCDVCDGEGRILRGRRQWVRCEACGGHGLEFTQLGRAVWELACRACAAIRQSEEGAGSQCE